MHKKKHLPIQSQVVNKSDREWLTSTRVSTASNKLKFSRPLHLVLYTAPLPRRHAAISARRARWSAPSAGRPGCPASLLRCCWTVMLQRATARSTAPARPGRTLTPACAELYQHRSAASTVRVLLQQCHTPVPVHKPQSQDLPGQRPEGRLDAALHVRLNAALSIHSEIAAVRAADRRLPLGAALFLVCFFKIGLRRFD